MSTMTRPRDAQTGAPPLRPLPSLGTAFRAQVRVMGINHRWELLGVTVLSLLLAVGIGSSIAHQLERQMDRQPDMVDVEGFREAFSVLPGAVVPLLLLAALWALTTWRHDRPSQRGYLLAAPIDRRLHQAVRIAAGWVWLMAATLVCLLALALFTTLVGASATFVRDLLAWGALPFLGETLAYLSASVLSLLSDHPAWWLLGILIGGPLLLGLLAAAVDPAVTATIAAVVSSFMHALTGMNPPTGTALPQSWGGAVLLWAPVTLGAVAAACTVRRKG